MLVALAAVGIVLFCFGCAFESPIAAGAGIGCFLWLAILVGVL